jgi:hypothetical protein
MSVPPALGWPFAKHATAVPITKLIVLNPAIISDQQNEAENRFNIRSDHGAALAANCLACVRLKVEGKNLVRSILSWLLFQARDRGIRAFIGMSTK